MGLTGVSASRSSVTSAGSTRLELNLPAAQGTEVLRRIVAYRDDFPVLCRDNGRGRLTVLHMVGARDVEDYERRAREWAEAVWRSWTSHHIQIAVAVGDIGET